jgi:hypothetical protein
MIRELIIIAEGYSEEEFVKNLIRPYLNQFGIVSVTPIKVSSGPGLKGGIRKGSYSKLRKDAQRYLLETNDTLVTTFIDYYHLPKDFPGYSEAMIKNPTIERIKYLENAMKDDISPRRFIPYIQMHEFEALLFTDIRGFKELPEVNSNHLDKIQEILNVYQNPEEINDGNDTSPSNRLINIIKSYNKILYGSYIPLVNGFNTILQKCPRFNQWIENLRIGMIANN